MSRAVRNDNPPLCAVDRAVLNCEPPRVLADPHPVALCVSAVLHVHDVKAVDDVAARVLKISASAIRVARCACAVPVCQASDDRLFLVRPVGLRLFNVQAGPAPNGLKIGPMPDRGLVNSHNPITTIFCIEQWPDFRVVKFKVSLVPVFCPVEGVE